MKRCYGILAAAVVLVFTGCASAPRPSQQLALVTTHAPQSAPAASLANGRSIFQTGRDLQGKHIVAQRRPLMSRCAACHGVSGAGGLHLPGGAVSADLRYKTLVLGQRRPYTLALLERAISRGIDDDGDTLNPVMPRWRLSQQDLHDVAYYVLHHLK